MEFPEDFCERSRQFPVILAVARRPQCHLRYRCLSARSNISIYYLVHIDLSFPDIPRRAGVYSAERALLGWEVDHAALPKSRTSGRSETSEAATESPQRIRVKGVIQIFRYSFQVSSKIQLGIFHLIRYFPTHD